MISNVDTLVVNFDVLGYDKSIKRYTPELEKQKERSRSYMYDNMNDKAAYILGNVNFEVMPSGARSYAYILHNDLIEIKLARARSSNVNTFPICVKYKSQLLWEKGLNAYFYAYDLIKRVFGDIRTTKVSRVDLACHVDFLELEVSDIDSFLGRFRKDTIHRLDRKVQTFYLGSRTSDTVMCRIYNKTQEILESRSKEWFFHIYFSNDMDLLNVWNVEFECRRKFLKQINIETYEDLVENIKNVWKYLTTKWLLMMVPDTATRLERCVVDERWLKIQHGYDRFKMIGHVERSRQRIADMSKYVPGCVGYLTSLSALMNIDNLDDALRTLKYNTQKYLNSKKSTDFETVVSEKRNYYTEIGIYDSRKEGYLE